MRNLKMNGSGTKVRSSRRLIGKTYDWRKFMEKHEDHDELIKQQPKFVTEKGSTKVEAWTVEAIRRKYFLELKKDYQRDYWMPKVLPFLMAALRKEMINLRDLARFLGMPQGYLVNLCQRDRIFRAHVIEWRNYNLEGKKESVEYAMVMGFDPRTLTPYKNSETNACSFLDYIDSSYTPDYQSRGFNYRYRIDVGWKPKTVSKKR